MFCFGAYEVQISEYLIAGLFQLGLHIVVSIDPMHLVGKITSLVHMLVAHQNELSHNLWYLSCGEGCQHVVCMPYGLLNAKTISNSPLRGQIFDDNHVVQYVAFF